VIDAGPGSRTATLVARQEIEYLRPLGYRRAPVIVELWIGRLGGASIDVCYEVQDGDPAGTGAVAAEVVSGDAPAAPAAYARACTTLVLVDPATGSPRRITVPERATWSPYLEPMVELRRRGSREAAAR